MVYEPRSSARQLRVWSVQPIGALQLGRVAVPDGELSVRQERVGLTLGVTLLNLGRNRRVTKRAPQGCAADSGDVYRTYPAWPGSTRSAPIGVQYGRGDGPPGFATARP